MPDNHESRTSKVKQGQWM